jgi:hypothetical protein
MGLEEEKRREETVRLQSFRSWNSSSGIMTVDDIYAA